MVRTFLIEPASSRGPYDDKATVTQGVVVYNLTHDESRQQSARAFTPYTYTWTSKALTYAVKRSALEHFSFSIVLRLALV